MIRYSHDKKKPFLEIFYKKQTLEGVDVTQEARTYESLSLKLCICIGCDESGEGTCPGVTADEGSRYKQSIKFFCFPSAIFLRMVPTK